LGKSILRGLRRNIGGMEGLRRCICRIMSQKRERATMILWEWEEKRAITELTVKLSE